MCDDLTFVSYTKSSWYDISTEYLRQGILYDNFNLWVWCQRILYNFNPWVWCQNILYENFNPWVCQNILYDNFKPWVKVFCMITSTLEYDVKVFCTITSHLEKDIELLRTVILNLEYDVKTFCKTTSPNPYGDFSLWIRWSTLLTLDYVVRPWCTTTPLLEHDSQGSLYLPKRSIDVELRPPLLTCLPRGSLHRPVGVRGGGRKESLT